MTYLSNNSLLQNRYFSLALLSPTNGLWTWGQNTSGALGSSNTTNRSSPVQVGLLSNWTQVSASNSTSASNYDSVLALQSNGTLWAWGNNSFGQLGTSNTNTSLLSPVQVGTNLWLQLSAGLCSMAIKNDGTMWGWGANSYGQVGANTGSICVISPTQVGSPNAIWTNVSTSSYHTLAIQTNGTLWVWGNNASGELGLNTSYASLPFYISPIQLGTLSTWTSVSAYNNDSMAIQSPGTLWTWGANNYGQLGLSDLTSRSSPTQVGRLSTWSRVACGYRFAAAIQNNGTLWSWGSNSYGQLGVGSAGSNIVSPVQIGALSVWSQVACGQVYMVALQNNGTLWSWGQNVLGQLGTSNTTNYSSPVQIGTLNNWNSVTCGGTFVASLQKP